MILPTPGSDFLSWGTQVADALVQYEVPQPTADWRSWGAALCGNPQVGALHPAQPYSFNDWRDWARALQSSLMGLRGAPGLGAS